MRAGWSGMFSAWKLCQSSSTSGPSATRKPRLVNTSTASRSTIVRGWNDPTRGARPGSDMSSRSASSRASSASRSSASPRATSAACSAVRTSFAARPTRLRSSGGRAPSDLWIALNGDRRPIASTWAASSCSGVAAASIRSRPRSRSTSSERSISSGSIRGQSLPAGCRPTCSRFSPTACPVRPGARGGTRDGRSRPSPSSAHLGPRRRPARRTGRSCCRPLSRPSRPEQPVGLVVGEILDRPRGTEQAWRPASRRRRRSALAPPPYERTAERLEGRLEPGGIGEDRLHLADPLHPRMVGIPSLGLGHALTRSRRRPAPGRPRACRRPHGRRRRACAGSCPCDPRRARCPAASSPAAPRSSRPTDAPSVPEALHGGEGRPDVVGGRGHDALEGLAGPQTTPLPLEQAHRRRRREVQRFRPARLRDADHGVGGTRDVVGQPLPSLPNTRTTGPDRSVR